MMKKWFDNLGNNVYWVMPPENDWGCIEYKWKLSSINIGKLNRLATQMRWRVNESDNNSALYVVGIHDNGQLTGLTKKDFIETYINLMDCAKMVGLCTCIRKFRCIDHDTVWAVIQVFRPNIGKNNVYDTASIPDVPDHGFPGYLKRSF